ncbi:hypothetical protein BSIN_1001 [Burkholderia singularis]|uniref:Uncharacterized protein n=1 Tax=Burkholderia singularis TaxID=1503053 RepID=A0A238HB26_9BURK|nr:hypothetical protein BSIN_1001 [Burkholderia singularis]
MSPQGRIKGLLTPIAGGARAFSRHATVREARQLGSWPR